MKMHPLIVFAIASVGIAQVPNDRPLTDDSLVILNICERNALSALKIGQLFPDTAEYNRGYADALRDAQQWLPIYLPRAPGPFIAPPVVPQPPVVRPVPHRGNEP